MSRAEFLAAMLAACALSTAAAAFPQALHFLAHSQ
jgi:hypothetical protein